MTWPKSRGANLLGEARCDRAGLSDTTYQSTPLDEAASQTHDRFSKHWYPGEVEDQPSPRVTARNPHTVRIIIGIDGNNLCNQRHKLFEDVELGSEGVEQDEISPLSVLDIAERVSINHGGFDRIFGAQ